MSIELETEGSPTRVVDSAYTFRELENGHWTLDATQTFDNGAESWACSTHLTLEDAQQAANGFHCGPAAVGSVHTQGGRVFLCVVGQTVEQIEQTYHCTRIKPTIHSQQTEE